MKTARGSIASAEVPEAFLKLPGLCERRDIGEDVMAGEVGIVNLSGFFLVRAVIEDGAVGRELEQAEGKRVENCFFFKQHVKKRVAGDGAYS